MSGADERQAEASRAPAAVFALLLLAFLVLSIALIFGDDPGHSTLESDTSSWSTKATALAIFLFALALVVWLIQPPLAPSDEVAVAVPLCPGCLAPYREGVHFCAHCAAPLTWYAATAWYEAVYAQAWCLGRAAHGPSRPIHVVGLGLLVAAYVGSLLVVLLSSLVSFADSWGQIGLLGELVMLWIYARLLRRCIANLDSKDPDQLDPERGPYGSPPWWTYDRFWALPEPEAEAPGSP